MYKTAPIIEKWYKKLDFPACYDEEFYHALKTVEIPSDTAIETYDLKCQDGVKNLLSVLYMCEKVESEYNKLGIPEEILIDTLKDLVTWCNIHTQLAGKLALGELEWLKRHLSLVIFKVGRLQFSKGESVHTVPEKDYFEGDAVMEIHIPEGEKLTKSACIESVEAGKDFFAKYFPDYKYKFINCHSWLLDSNLKKYLKGDSNILDFQSLFDIVLEHDSFAVLRYVFKWGTTVDNLSGQEPSSSFAKRIKEATLSGEVFHEAVGLYRY